jgi:RimJ/RimL family protein N-acetyltransferase
MSALRKVVAERDGVALVELLEGDQAWLDERGDGAFESDPDDREPLQRLTVYRLGVADAMSGELVGSLSWHAEGYGPTVNCAAWNIGIALLPAARGRGIGSGAQRMLAEYLFATTEVDRIEASTEVTNVAERRALTRAGFRPEGVIRGAAMRGGERRDYLGFALLRSDLRPASEERVIVAARDGVGLAEPFPGDVDIVFKASASEFDQDEDHRPRPMLPPAPGHHLIILDTASGTLLGGMSWHAVDYGGTLGATAWNIGIGLIPEARGRGVGTLAQRLLAEHLFATTELDRVEASTDVANLPEQRALEKAGFRREGVLRGTQVRGGVRRDLVQYGVLRSDL